MSEKQLLIEEEIDRIPLLNTRSKLFCLVLLAVGLVLVAGIVVVIVKFDEFSYPAVTCQRVGGPKPKNLILMVGDGFGQNYNSFARVMKGGPLLFDQHLLGQIYTQSMDDVVTDSAAGATAFSTG
jgi:alkaline phosphatase